MDITRRVSWYGGLFVITGALVLGSAFAQADRSCPGNLKKNGQSRLTERQEEAQRKRVLSLYADSARRRGEDPKLKEFLEESGLTKKEIRELFPDDDLKAQARERHPDKFKNVLDPEIFTAKRFEQLQRDVGEYDRFVITTAVAGQEIFDGFYEAIQNYSRNRDAVDLFLPATQRTNALTPKVVNDNVVFRPLTLSPKFVIDDHPIEATAVSPLAGLRYKVHQLGTTVVAAPRRLLEFYGVGNTQHPEAVMTTGAVTIGAYSGKFEHNRGKDRKATDNHWNGALIAERDGELMHFRHVVAESDGSFVDLGKRFHPNGKVSKAEVAGLVLGDWHAGWTEPSVKAATAQMIKKFGVKTVYGNDVADFISINPHVEDRAGTRMRRIREDRASLEDEFKFIAEDIRWFFSLGVDKFVMVPSNHHDFLMRWLEKRGDAEPKNERNSIIGALLYAEFARGGDPVRAGLAMIMTPAEMAKIEFPAREDDIICEGVNVVHGDKGAGGSRNPSTKTLSKMFGEGTAGHSHNPGIQDGFTRVGTSTVPRMGYNEGMREWVSAHEIIYKRQSEDDVTPRQLIIIREGRWTSQK